MKRLLIFPVAVFLLFGLIGCQKEPDPNVAVQEGLNAFIDVEKSSFEVNVKGASTGADGPMELSLVIAGKSNSADKDDIRADFDIKGEIKTAGKTAKIDLDFRTLEKILFVRLNSVDLPGAAISQEVLSQFLGKWWEIPSQSEQGTFEKLTADQEQFAKVVRDNLLFTNIRFVSEEEVRNLPSRKYQVDINKETLQKILEVLPTLEGGVPVAEADKAALAARLQEIDFSGNVWVAKDDDSVHRIAGTLRVAPKNDDPVSLDLDMEAWGFGENMAIEKPADAQPFNPVLLLGLVGSLLPQNQPVPPAAPSEPIDQPLGAEQVK